MLAACTVLEGGRTHSIFYAHSMQFDQHSVMVIRAIVILSIT